ncbi:MAG: AAC(3) family N-acetyltransferase, partial [Crocinitomicaceae bacterium]|nr:AAC(3) family N-acetyltransferase [Crocinitomicaceae bacterium]
MNKIQGSYTSIASQLPLGKSDILFIASDIKQIALNCRSKGESFDVNAFIESFQEVLSEGTLIIPSYTDYLKNGETFDHSKSKPSTGALSNKVLRRKEFIRSTDPLHSVLAWGKHAE